MRRQQYNDPCCAAQEMLAENSNLGPILEQIGVFAGDLVVIVLSLLFVVIAFLYSSVGFGGGSSYTALLMAAGFDYSYVPVVSLLCNLIVVSGGVYHYSRQGALDWRFAMPLIVGSVPAAFIGGTLRLAERDFVTVLGAALLVSGLLLLLDRQWRSNTVAALSAGVGTRFVFGLLLGGLAGITGIGGGIYLAPLLHLLNMATARTVAATASLFIFANSIAGLAGHWIKLSGNEFPSISPTIWFLPIAVLIGGQLGSRLGARRLPAVPIRRLTGVVVLIVALRLLWPLFS